VTDRPIAAFQGERGAFSEEAVRNLLGVETEVVPCRTFEDVFETVRSGRASHGVVPIENSLAGSVLRNYELLADADLTIVGETFVRISLNLIGRSGTRLEDVRRVYSHPVALAQCNRFLTEHAFEVSAAYDTAGSVKMVMEGGQRDEAGIAGPAAAEIYGGEIIAAGIEDHHANYTRFLLLSLAGHEWPAKKTDTWKTTLLFRTPNKPGALFRALAAFALRDINLVKIESRPIEGRPWEYSFYADIIGEARDSNIRRGIDHLREMCETVRVLGSYPAGEWI
jgi:prephenate dehydratase